MGSDERKTINLYGTMSKSTSMGMLRTRGAKTERKRSLPSALLSAKGTTFYLIEAILLSMCL